MTLRNVWHLYNLVESPFFQHTLRTNANARYPLSVIVAEPGLAVAVPPRWASCSTV
jgi:hypothetical protein